MRVLGNDGSGSDDDVAKGIDYAIAQRADVINLSLGGLPIDALVGGGEFQEAVQRAVDAGIVVVSAAGNDSVPLCEQPASRARSSASAPSTSAGCARSSPAATRSR